MGSALNTLRHVMDRLVQSATPATTKVLMLGLDGAGKTTVLYKLKLNETINTIPTLGFNVETVQLSRGVSFTVWDVGGQHKIRPLWRHYFTGCAGLIYIIDSADKNRFEESREELSWIVEDNEMKGIPVVVLANKQDLPVATGPVEVGEKLGLGLMRGHKWSVHGISAISGDGLDEAIQEFSKMIKERSR